MFNAKGLHCLPCFKCKDRENGRDCDACYKGKIRGFNLHLCPWCRGKGSCENCFGRAFVSCRCGPSCRGHGLNEVPTFTSASLSHLQCRVAKEKENQDWSAKFLSRNWQSPLTTSTGERSRQIFQFGKAGDALQPATPPSAPSSPRGKAGLSDPIS